MSSTLQAMQAIKQQQQQSQQQQQQQTSSVKKKFGKNLTKLVQSQQQVTQTDIRSSSSNSTNRNGLLLLSTNKKSSGLLAASNDNSGISNSGGLLPFTGSGSIPPAARDAWGVNGNPANSNNKTVQDTTPSLSSAFPTSYDGSSNLEDLQQQKRQQQTASRTDNNETRSDYEAVADRSTLHASNIDDLPSPGTQQRNIGVMRTASGSTIDQASSTPWDEYGGRDRSSRVQGSDIEVLDAKKPLVQVTVDADKEYMSTKAKERAVAMQKAEQVRVLEQRNRAAARLLELNHNNNNSTNEHRNSTVVLGHAGAHQSHDTVHHNHQEQTMPPTLIHLNGYEDRDRGMSTQSSQPRMLFDPKSGSMVAVKARDENANAANKSKKLTKKSQDLKNTGNKAANSRQQLVATTSKDGRTRKPSDADIPVKLQLLKNTNPTVETVVKVKKLPPPVITHVRRSLPRTCGVLYTRNKIGVAGSNSNDGGGGTMYCADGCEGDLGYGAHSVPGGRTRNPVTYAKRRQQMQQYNKMSPNSPNMFRSNGSSSKHPSQTKNGVGHDLWESNEMTNRDVNQKIPGYSRTTAYDNKVGKFAAAGNRAPALLYTGFNPSQVSENIVSDEYDPSLQHQLEWVTADDKLELVGMDDDEPTLKPTAKVFAPSQAALAAAATLRTQDSMCSEDDYVDDDEDDDMNSNDNILMGVGGGYDDNLDDIADEYDDDDIDDHHHQTVNKAAMDILDDDDFMGHHGTDVVDDFMGHHGTDVVDDFMGHHGTDVVGLHNHHALLHGTDSDPLGLGFDPTHDITELIQKSSKSSTSRLVQLEELPLEPAMLVSPFSSAMRIENVVTTNSLHEENVSAANKFGSRSHNIFGFGSSSDPWSTSTNTNTALVSNVTDWDVDILGLAAGGRGSNAVGLVGSARSSASSGLFNTTDNSFDVTGLVGGIASNGSSWGTSGVVVPNAFDEMILNGTGGTGEASHGPGNQGED